MNIIKILMAILTASFVFIVIINSKRKNLEALLFNEGLIRKLEAANNLNKNKIFNSFNFGFYLDNYKNTRIFGFKIDSAEKLLILKIFFSFSAFVLINFLGIFFQKNFIVISVIGALIFFFLPSEILKSRLNNVKNKVLIELPDFIDVLFSLINAGLSLDESIKYFAENYNGEIKNLFKLFRIRQMEGFSKKEAYEQVGRLSFCEEFERIVKILAQSEIVGNPIKDILRNFSAEIRNNQKDQLKIKAEKLESSLIFIIFIFIFIPMLLIFLVPVFPQIKLLF